MTATDILNWMKQNGTEATRIGMKRYGIETRQAFGITMAQLKNLKKRVPKNQALSEALWNSGWYEARMFASMIGDPKQVTAEQMDRWAASFENWADCDTVCFNLFDRAPDAWQKAYEWAASPDRFVKRAAFALMASLTVHDKTAADDRYLACLPSIEAAAQDDRNFVKKAVNWALRSIGKRNLTLNDAAIELAQSLSLSSQSAPRWVGKDALRELTSAKVQDRLTTKLRKANPKETKHD